MTDNPTIIEIAKKLLEFKTLAYSLLNKHGRATSIQCAEANSVFSDYAELHSATLAQAVLDLTAVLEEEARINGASGERELALLARAEWAEWAEKRVEVLEKGLEPIQVLGMNVGEIHKLKIWFENKSGKSITDFWEEAFDAGVKTALHMSRPPDSDKNARIRELESCLRECNDDLAGEIEEKYPTRHKYPDEQRRYARDMKPVDRARIALAPTTSGEGE